MEKYNFTQIILETFTHERALRFLKEKSIKNLISFASMAGMGIEITVKEKVVLQIIKEKKEKKP